MLLSSFMQLSIRAVCAAALKPAWMQITLANIMMKTPPKKSSLLPPLIAGIAVLLFGSASVAHRLDWRPGMPRAIGTAAAAAANVASARADRAGAALLLSEESNAESNAKSNPESRATSQARLKRRCSECGVVESIREIGSGGAAGTALNRFERYEVILRLSDGSRQVISNAPAGTWRIGERVIAIAPLQASIK